MIGISIDEDLEALRRIVAIKGIPWPQVCDGKGAESEIPQLYGPESTKLYLLDPEGRIVFRHYGSKGLKAIEEKIAGLLGK